MGQLHELCVWSTGYRVSITLAPQLIRNESMSAGENLNTCWSSAYVIQSHILQSQSHSDELELTSRTHYRTTSVNGTHCQLGPSGRPHSFRHPNPNTCLIRREARCRLNVSGLQASGGTRKVASSRCSSRGSRWAPGSAWGYDMCAVELAGAPGQTMMTTALKGFGKEESSSCCISRGERRLVQMLSWTKDSRPGSVSP